MQNAEISVLGFSEKPRQLFQLTERFLTIPVVKQVKQGSVL